MKKIPEQPAPPDGDLFRQAMEGVNPLPPSNRVTPSPVRPTVRQSKTAVSAVSTSSDFFSDHGASENAPTSFLRPGMNSMTLRKLRRGQWPIESNIDLHGNTSDGARRLLVDFIEYSVSGGLRCVSVIHGKGWRTEGGEGILKIRVRHWLTQHPQILAFCEAPAYAGGGGAVWLLLVSGTKLTKPKG